MSDGMSLVDLLRRSARARKQELKGADVEAQKNLLAMEVMTRSMKVVARRATPRT